MHVVTYDRFGPAAEVLHLGQMDLPTLGADEVRVALHRSGVNPSDVKSRAGTRPGVTKPAFDRIIPHSDGAGVIEAVGSNIDPARIGARVWIWNGQWQRPFGTAASHITLPSDQAVDLPDAVDFDAAASLGIPGLTAAQAAFGAGDVAGQTILVQGGSGTVSYLAVQLAKWGGARVIATASPRDFDRVRDAGADVVLDYGAEDLSDQILAATSGAFVDQSHRPQWPDRGLWVGQGNVPHPALWTPAVQGRDHRHPADLPAAETETGSDDRQAASGLCRGRVDLPRGPRLCPVRDS